MTGQIVNVIDIDKNSYKVRPPRWIFLLYVLALLIISSILISQPSITSELKWFVVVIVFIACMALFKASIKINYLVTLFADRKGLYFPSRIAEEYFLIPWAYILTMEKVSFPLNSRGLRVEVECKCFNAAVSEIGNVTKEQGRCFIYTIPQMRNRNKIIEDLERIKRSYYDANPKDDIGPASR